MIEWTGSGNLRQWRIVVEHYPNAEVNHKWYWEVREGGELLDAGHTVDEVDALEETQQCISRHL